MEGSKEEEVGKRSNKGVRREERGRGAKREWPGGGGRRFKHRQKHTEQGSTVEPLYV